MRHSIAARSSNGLLLGAKLGFPVCVSFLIFGLTFGVAAVEKGVSPANATLASLTVFSGSSQFLILDMLGSPAELAGIAITVFLLNIRHLMMGAALVPHMRGAPYPVQILGTLFMIDETWAIAMSPDAEGSRLHVLVGSGLVAMAGWVAGTAAGAVLGGLIVAPERIGADFVYYAVFLFILASMWNTRTSALPWLVAAGVAVATAQVLPGKWYVVTGGLAGALIGGAQPWTKTSS